MTENEQLVSEIVNGIQDKKGKRIAVVNLTALKEAPCGYFVICEGDSNVQVAAIATSVKDHVRDVLRSTFAGCDILWCRLIVTACRAMAYAMLAVTR